jgi:choice-of-anchor A domain-containing protein
MVIVNITGTLPGQINFTLMGGVSPSDLVWNYLGTTPSVAGGGFGLQGILLAPNLNVGYSGNINVTGQFIVNSYYSGGGGTITFAGPEVPEPSSLSIVAIGTAALLGQSFLRRRKPPG